MEIKIPEKAQLLMRLREGGFNVPPFVYLPAEDFRRQRLDVLKAFTEQHCTDYKVIARSAHPMEDFYRGGTFESLETHADILGITYARQKIVTSARTAKRLSILRQQKFNGAPAIDEEEMGLIVMPFIEGRNIMAKVLGNSWEFGYCGERRHKVQLEPSITRTPHDARLLQVSQKIQDYLGFACEIEYILSEEGELYVVQAKDISHIETLEVRESERSVQMDGIRRIRKRRNYRERPMYVMDNKEFYLSLIGACEDLVHGMSGAESSLDDILNLITAYESELEDFALKHERFGVLGLSIRVPEALYQIANHYLDETPDLQKELSAALNRNMYKIDHFLSEADTLIAKERIRIQLCSHEAYGIDTVRNPIWSVYWHAEKHSDKVKELKRVGFRTGDTVGVDIDPEDKPTVYRL